MVTHKKWTFFPPFIQIQMKSPSNASTSTNRKTASLDIVGFDDREQRHPPGFDLPPWMPMHEFFMLIVAPAGCGKTTLILNLLLRIYRSYFNKIIVFSPTIHNDQKWKHLTSSKNVLRPNKHKKHWLPKVKEQKEESQKDSSSSDTQKYTEEEKEWLDAQNDLFLIENFKDKKGMKKRLGSTNYKMWKLLSSQPQFNAKKVSGHHMANPEQILQKKRRIDHLSSFMVKPTTPVLAQQLKDYHRVLGLPEPSILTHEDRRIFSSTAAYLAICGKDGSIRRENGGGAAATGNLGPHNIGQPDFRGAGGGMFGGGQVGQRHLRSGLSNSFPQYNPKDKAGHHHGKNSQHTRGHQQQIHPKLTAHCGRKGEVNEYEDESEEEEPSDKQESDDSEKEDPKTKGQVPKACLHEEYSEETLDDAMKYQDKVVSCLTKMKRPMTEADHICWVFDDMVGSGLFNQKKNNAFKRLSVRRRHFCSSVIGVVQAYKEFPKTSRNNCNIYILFRIDSEDELSVIYKDFPCGLSAQNWKIVYEYCTREPYAFMMINTQVKDPTFRIIKNFTEPLYIPEDKRLHDQWVQQFIRNEDHTSANLFPESVNVTPASSSSHPSLSSAKPTTRQYASIDFNNSSLSSTAVARGSN